MSDPIRDAYAGATSSFRSGISIQAGVLIDLQSRHTSHFATCPDADTHRRRR